MSCSRPSSGSVVPGDPPPPSVPLQSAAAHLYPRSLATTSGNATPALSKHPSPRPRKPGSPDPAWVHLRMLACARCALAEPCPSGWRHRSRRWTDSRPCRPHIARHASGPRLPLRRPALPAASSQNRLELHAGACSNLHELWRSWLSFRRHATLDHPIATARLDSRAPSGTRHGRHRYTRNRWPRATAPESRSRATGPSPRPTCDPTRSA